MAVLLQLPAFFASCTKTREALPEDRQTIYIMNTKAAPQGAIDLFFFDTLGSERLDAYQQVVQWESDRPVYGMSGTGAGRLVALSGTAGETGRWADIRTYGHLQKHSFALSRESAASPLLSGELFLDEGTSRQVSLDLRPLLSAIRFRSVACDFSGRAYAGQRLQILSVFLSYAGSESLPLAAGGDGELLSWINPGYLDSAAVRALPQPDMLWQRGCGTVGDERVFPEQTFYCYPGANTHLVLEAQVGDIRCYYPIPLPPLQRDTCLQLDVTLRLMGSPDPDTPTVSGAVVLETQILPWEEREPCTVLF